MSAAPAAARDARLLWAALGYELRRVTTWRAGFVLREVMRGMWRPLVMIFVYGAILEGGTLAGGEVASIGGYTFEGMVRYLILAATFEKLLFHQRGLDLADQIFQGYVTKYLVMPLRFFVLALARFAQHLAVQGSVAGALWLAGLALLPATWPRPASAAAFAEAALLVLLGSYCYFLVCFLVNTLAFWLDVVWTLFAMTSFVFSFVAGVLVPVSVMPAPVREVFQWLFPYWAVSAPVELFLGRLGHSEFLRGTGVLLATIALLEVARQALWRRGLARYTGAGM
jgi:ABC-2 type transport system permease protein